MNLTKNYLKFYKKEENMKSTDKLIVINDKLKKLNDNVLRNKKWKLNYINRGGKQLLHNNTIKRQ